jgi:23S rRNA (guanosine2251-2'-O)-methyltransferase
MNERFVKRQMEELPRLEVDGFKQAEKMPVVVVLDNVRSLNNIGSVFRSADAFLVREIILCGITATPPHKDINKTALGATESVDWRYESDTHDAVAQLRLEGYRVWALEQAHQSQMLDQWVMNPDQPQAIILGHEVDGVQQSVVALCDGVLEIPQWGTKHSLNVSVSAGIVLWECARQWSALKH